MNILNLGILAHVDAGKTSLCERILYDLKIIRKLGNIEEQNTFLDSLSLEKERGITITNSYLSFNYSDTKINLIDTPGHFDFVDEVESVFEILDCIVLVVSSLDGVQSQTKKIWSLIEKFNIPTIIYLNKIDLIKEDISLLDENIHNYLSENYVRINPEIFYDTSNYLEEDIYKIIENNDKLELEFLENGNIDKDILYNEIKTKFHSSKLYPLIYGSAHEGIGISKLLDILVSLKIKRKSEELSAFVYKIKYTEQFGKSAYIKVSSGSLKPKDYVTFNNSNKVLKKQQIALIQQNINGSLENVDEVFEGDIAILYGIKDVSIGDTIGNYKPKKYNKTPSLYSLMIKENNNKIIELNNAIYRLSKEHSSLEYNWFEETSELQISIIGKIQGDIIIKKLEDEYNLSIKHSEPRIIYKETPSKESIGYEEYTMPKPSWAIVKFKIEPLEDKDQVIFINKSDNDKLLPRYHSQIETGIKTALKQGRLGWEVTGLKISLIDGESHIMHTSPLDFTLATPIGIHDGLDKANMVLLEPNMLFKIEVDVSYYNKVLSDIFSMEGEIKEEIFLDNIVKIKAIVPLFNSSNYINEFFQSTKGTGVINQEFYEYRPCPKHRYQINKRKGIDPLDRDKWILYKRGAFGRDMN